MTSVIHKRLESLDILRGFDLFCLVGLETLIHSLRSAIHTPFYDSIVHHYFDHIEWAGFSAWDLVMPLFMFMAGVSMPFAFGKYADKKLLYRRIVKRVLLLWVFGMICQGNLLALDPQHVYLYSNTLQAIAMGYLIAALLLLHTRKTVQVTVAVALLLLYWAAMEWGNIGGYGGGDYTPDANLAEGIDRLVLGRFRDMAQVRDGVVVFAEYYRYTWILSSLTFGVTVLTGVFAGDILRNQTLSSKNKVVLLTAIGALMLATAWIWDFRLPIIKKIWTSSMVMLSSGYCFLLMALFYWWIDHKGHRRGLQWLKVYGKNSIVAYMLAMTIRFGCISESVFFGLKQYIGDYYSALIAASNAVIIYLILYTLYKKKLFLRV
ncbi:MAG: DUF5009 domain-containing protein [Candidatus Symbiothrix sp.]|nr:DUF5009 domain-containing protein [Candidatus Symbiothrix sp.]